MGKKNAQKSCAKKLSKLDFGQKYKKIFFGVPETQTARQSKRVIFRKKNLEEQLSKVAQEKWPKNMSKKKKPKKNGQKICPKEKCPTE